MHSFKLSNFVFFVSILFITVQVGAQGVVIKQDSAAASQPLKVGIAGNEPFVFNDLDNPRGIAIEIWEDLANEKEWTFKYVPFNTVNAALTALQNKELDLVVGPISITSDRVTKMSFSQPYYQSSLSIASRADGKGLWSRIKPFFSFSLLVAVGIFVFILAIVGTLFWLAEHKASPEQFPKDPVKGIGNGMWLAIVTMSTTGYGDMAPITLRGRIIAGIWMVVTIIFATSMVAGIASTLTLSGLGTSTIRNAEELSTKKAATIAGSPAVAFLKEYSATVIQTSNLDEAMNKLKNKTVDAVVYDQPQLMYFLKVNNDENLYIAKAEYYKQGYGFAFPLTSPLVYDVNRTLLRLAEEHVVQEIIDEYLGKQK
ncbi:transporter substrate-binding domain-containing protein [Cryomorpha ignava]|uniref:Transporter substrate-binding domain-containing protein n=1 Tax=Cryomorpha ignava TaxID=101383 RepID=A0A7K3WLI3_9FLAO|nr:transporter substrate-binding domain-containing protein [Cryomorpha ignava]NEN22378.1 transporter substrate-binding domain-containing protein [Cryomorpha ignava]